MLEINNAKRPFLYWAALAALLSGGAAIIATFSEDYWSAIVFTVLAVIQAKNQRCRVPEYIDRIAVTSDEVSCFYPDYLAWKISFSEIEKTRIRARSIYLFYRRNEELRTCKIRQSDFDATSWRQLKSLVSRLPVLDQGADL